MTSETVLLRQGDPLSKIMVDEFPEELRQTFETIRHAMNEISLEESLEPELGTTQNTTQELPIDSAVKLAREIVDLFDVICREYCS